MGWLHGQGHWQQMEVVGAAAAVSVMWKDGSWGNDRQYKVYRNATYR